MPNIFNISCLKRDQVNYSQQNPPPPQLRKMADQDPEDVVEVVFDHQGTLTKTLQYTVKWLHMLHRTGYCWPI